ncbi:hypothetical protein GGP41_007812, partial [Bipolaris sorokiniana]
RFLLVTLDPLYAKLSERTLFIDNLSNRVNPTFKLLLERTRENGITFYRLLIGRKKTFTEFKAHFISAAVKGSVLRPKPTPTLYRVHSSTPRLLLKTPALDNVTTENYYHCGKPSYYANNCLVLRISGVGTPFRKRISTGDKLARDKS